MSINVNDKNLGHATAYAYYKAGGGTMTEAEFTEFMADFGTASQTAVEAAQAALASKNAAQTAATTATNKATEATTAATTATTKAGEASTSASTATSAKDTAVSASQTATSKATEATTAAATAVSAKDDAVSANTAAQSAKTAAQTAQTGAETAAASVEASAAQIATNAEDISQLKSELSEVIESNSYTDETIINNTPTFTVGAMAQTGMLFPSYTSFNYTQKIAVQPGDVVTAIGNSDNASMRWVCAYSGDTVVSEKGNAADAKTYTVPDGIDGVVITVRINNAVNNIKITRNEEKTVVYLKHLPMGYMTKRGVLTDGESITLSYQNVKINNCYIFNANITEFSSITFKKENNTYITVDATNLSIVNDQTSLTIPHGLTIGSNITLMVQNEESISISLVRLVSDGVVFDYTTATRFLMDSGTPTITSDGSTLTECTFSWVSKNINAPIWMFGDSYFSWYAQRWTYYLAQDGYTKTVMLNGYAGQASASAYTALVNLLSVTTPKMVVWCLGMNDPDTNSAVNASWNLYYEKIQQLQKKYGFELVLYTVPTTPTMNNRFKNAIIRESGYRYIETDLAVRVNDNGDWVTGALDGDNVHPTAIGAKILYYRILADLPEIMCNM